VKSRANSTLALLFAVAFWTACSSSRPQPSPVASNAAAPESPELAKIRRLLDDGISLQAKGKYANSQATLSAALSELSMLDSAVRTETVGGLTQQVLGAMKNNLPYSLDPESLEEPEDNEEDGLALIDSLFPDTTGATSLDSASVAKMLQELEVDSATSYDLPVEINDLVLLHLRFFKERMPQHFARWIERKGRWEGMITQELAAHGMPKDLLYLAMIESGFNPRATSPAAAAGIWQFIPATGRRFGLRIDRYVDERRDPWKATQAAIQYLSVLYQMFGDWRLAMASYNCGESCVGRSIRKSGSSDYWRISLPRETRNYVPKVFAAAILGKNPRAHGFDVQPWSPIVVDTFTVEGGLTFHQIAQSLGLPAESLAVLNPALTRGTTPPLKDNWVLHLPLGTRERFAQVAPTLERNYQAPQPQRFAYKVKRKESLAAIAGRFGVSVADLKRWNHIGGKKVRAGRRLVIWGDMPGMGVAISEPPLRTRGDGIPERSGWKIKSHKVRRGETLAGIGRKYGVSTSQLMEWNGLSAGKLKPGKRVYVSDPSAGMTDTTLIAGLPRKKTESVAEIETPAASAESPASDVSRPATHRVRRGETLSSIARRFDVDPDDLRAWNDLKGDRVRNGQRLKLQGEQRKTESVAAATRKSAPERVARVVKVSDDPEENPVSRIHRVRMGETLESIAHQYGVAVTSLKIINRLRGSRIRVGQKLTVPGSGSSVERRTEAPSTPAKVVAPKPRTVRYVVRPGDSLYSIARAKATTVDSLMELNGLRKAVIRPGQVIEVPMVASR